MKRRNLMLAGAAALCSVGAASAVAAPVAQEQSRIDRLISFVERQKGMTFVRNGTEYNCEEAGRFLRGKLEAMGSEITTARQFIERIASKSSMSGKPYEVKFADGRVMLAENFLGEELKRIERQAA